MYKYAVIGGGIVGLSAAMELCRREPGAKLIVLEKESRLAAHQTGHNSGVIHSGIYYKPGSFKARFAREGSRAMVEFCREHSIPYEICGKVIVATHEAELPLLERLLQRGLDNGLNVRKIGRSELREIEPHANGIAAIHVPGAGIVDYRLVSAKFAELIKASGGEIRLNAQVRNIVQERDGVLIETDRDSLRASVLINCGGLFSDRLARKAGSRIDMQIVPFRGEYYKLKEHRKHLVKNLIYPVPDPNFPFLGVHFTRMIDGSVEAGPNAVLSFKREGYRKTDVHLRDLAEVLVFPGFWKLAGRHMKAGLDEMARSFSKRRFVQSLQRLIPEITADDVEPAPAGVRAQAMRRNGDLVDDFYIVPDRRCLHVCNSPSPAATASIRIGKYVADQVDKLLQRI